MVLGSVRGPGVKCLTYLWTTELSYIYLDVLGVVICYPLVIVHLEPWAILVVLLMVVQYTMVY